MQANSAENNILKHRPRLHILTQPGSQFCESISAGIFELPEMLIFPLFFSAEISHIMERFRPYCNKLDSGGQCYDQNFA
jgi:hypothetical protein